MASDSRCAAGAWRFRRSRHGRQGVQRTGRGEESSSEFQGLVLHKKQPFCQAHLLDYKKHENMAILETGHRECRKSSGLWGEACPSRSRTPFFLTSSACPRHTVQICVCVYIYIYITHVLQYNISYKLLYCLLDHSIC